MEIIKCRSCRKDKDVNCFSIFHGRKNKMCIECRTYHNNRYKVNSDGYKDKRKQYYITHKAEHRNRAFKNHLIRKYNISLDEYNEMIRLQKNRCLICKKDFSTMKKWNAACVDHCHKTGRIRGILCRKCNLMLSYIENLNLWKPAQEYLKSMK